MGAKIETSRIRELLAQYDDHDLPEHLAAACDEAERLYPASRALYGTRDRLAALGSQILLELRQIEERIGSVTSVSIEAERSSAIAAATVRAIAQYRMGVTRA